MAQETILYFTSELAWTKGNYELHVESRLEDLAGDNRDRLFDTDRTQMQNSPQSFHKRKFEIK